MWAIRYCEDLSFADYDDWRLPSVRELESLVDYGRSGPSMAPVFEAFSDGYWSSTTVADSSEDAWIGFFDQGFFYLGFKTGADAFIRAVRSL